MEPNLDSHKMMLYEQGFIRPLPCLWTSSMVDSVSEKILSVVTEKSEHPLYARHAVRDWHLVFPELLEFVTHPVVLSQLQSVMGQDLLLWRSHIFYKPPGGGPVGWHQDFGTFSGEDIGNNKISLLPPSNINIGASRLQNYLNEATALSESESAPDHSDFWNMTLWVALSDVRENMGPLMFVPGSHRRRYPVRLRKLTESDFWQDPFRMIHNKEELISACSSSRLVLDLDTSNMLSGVSTEECTYEDLRAIVLSKLEDARGSATVVDEVSSNSVVSCPMEKGQYLIFSERTLHGSSGNSSGADRLAINFRITPSNTLVYPSRLNGDYIDGFNLDISRHKCILLSGRNLNSNNVVA